MRPPPPSRRECFNWWEISIQHATPSSSSYILYTHNSSIFPKSWRGDIYVWLFFLHLWPSIGSLPQRQSPGFKSLTDYESPRFTTPLQKEVSLTVESDNSSAVCTDKNNYLEGNLTGTSHLFSKTIAVAFLWGPWPPAMEFALVMVPYMSYCLWNKFYIPSKSREWHLCLYCTSRHMSWATWYYNMWDSWLSRTFGD